MAGFKTHITVSTMLGVGYGAAGLAYGFRPESCVLAGGLCSIGGMLPDLDSSSGVPYRESMAFLSAFVPLLLLQRFQHLGWSREQIVLACAVIYVVIRFGVARIFRNYTVHRGMWHSIPACASVGLITFLVSDDQSIVLRTFWTGAAVLGFMSHLVLDEFYSFEWYRGHVRFKKSLGTALKFWTNQGAWPNISTYGKLLILLALVWGDPSLSEYLQQRDVDVPQTARKTEQTHDQPSDEPAPFGAKLFRR